MSTQIPRPTAVASRGEPAAGGAPLRLAVFGWVQVGGGSVSSAHHQLCAALLRAGHRLDLFASAGHVPDPGFDHRSFDYVAVAASRGGGWLAKLPGVLAQGGARLAGRRSTYRYLDRSLAAARVRHAQLPYDAALFLGTTPRGALDGAPSLVWAQCAPQNELRAARGLVGPVRRVSGLGAYLRLRGWYEVKDHLVWGWARRDHLVLESLRARDEAVAFGVPSERVCIAPYPIDLERFTPGAIPTGPVHQILCVGRLDPRKRIDLLVDAVVILARRRNDFHVEVIGRDGYLPGWSAFVERAARELPLTYTPAVPQAEILTRLRAADALVQPSEREPFGHAVAEALACGVPVVTGPTNRTGEWVPAAGSASFDRYEPASLADALERVLDLSRDPAARAACREAASAFAAERVAARLVAHLRAAHA